MKTKHTTRFILFTLTLSAMLLSACSGVSVPVTGDNSNVNGSPSTPVIVDNGNNANANDANANDANSNDVNSNDASSNDNTGSGGNTNDSGIEIVGVVEAITEDTITINGVTYLLPAGFTEFRELVSVGDQVKVQVLFNADGTFTILQLEIIPGNDNGNNNVNSNDDNSNSDNSNDDNGNDDNSNDDNGGNGNDDDGGNNNNDNGGNNNG